MERLRRIYRLHQFLAPHRTPASLELLQKELGCSRATVNSFTPERARWVAEERWRPRGDSRRDINQSIKSARSQRNQRGYVGIEYLALLSGVGGMFAAPAKPAGISVRAVLINSASGHSAPLFTTASWSRAF